MKEFVLFHDKKLNEYRNAIPATIRSAVASLTTTKQKIEATLPKILKQIVQKVQSNVPQAKQKSMGMQTTYMRDYPNYSKVGIELPDIVALYNEKGPVAASSAAPVSTKEPSSHPPSKLSPDIKKPINSSSASETMSPLKLVLYPSELISEFVKKSAENTKDSIETCGILCGIKKAAYLITNIFVPKQKGTCDMCVTLNYEEIQHYVSKWNLLVLGWIHTHPDYTCFLSSVDVHTQYGYQKLLPESIAIVCSGLPLPTEEK